MTCPGLRWRVFVAIFAVTVASAIAFWIAIPPTYLTNDDVSIRRDLEGLTTPDAAPTGYVLMAHSLLGWTLVGIQRIAPVHAWDVVIAGLLLASVALAMAIAWTVSVGTAARVLAVAAVLVIIAPLFAGLQFTISATLAGTAAMLSAGLELLLPVPRRSVLAASAALFVLGVLVRPMAATAGALLAIATLVPGAVLDADIRRRSLKRMGITAVAILAAVLALVYVDDMLYQLSPAWATYHEDNWMTARLFEWGGDLPGRTVEPLRAQVGLTANDWELLRRWWGVDPTVHSHARIEALYGAWSGVADWHQRLDWLLQRAATAFAFATVTRLVMQSATACAAAVLLAIAAASWRGIAASIGAAVIFFAACVVIEIGFKELPFRLFGPLQVGLVLAVLVTSRVAGTTHRVVTACCAAIALGLAIQQTWLVGQDARADRRQSKEVDAQVAEVLQLHPSLLVLHADSFPSEFWWRPFHTPPTRLATLQLGLNNHNPYVQNFVARSRGSSLLRAICTDPSILVVSEPSRLEPVTAYMREHYGTRVDWQLVYSGSFRVWRCSPAGSK